MTDEPERLSRPFSTAGADATAQEPEELLEQALEEARARGYREGQARAEAELAGEIETIQEGLAGALRQIACVEESITRKHETLLLEIVVEAASRIARDRLDAGDPIAARALQEAMEALPSGGALRARVHPDDVASVTAMLSSEIEAGRVGLVPDAGISRGGSVVESEAGIIDATLETAIRSTRAAALGEEQDR